MSDTLLTNDWKYVCQYLPDNLSDLAKACGAVDRWRNISNGEELLGIILAYAVDDLSLRSTAAWSTRSQLVMKDTSILHRLRKSPRLFGIGPGSFAQPSSGGGRSSRTLFTNQ